MRRIMRGVKLLGNQQRLIWYHVMGQDMSCPASAITPTRHTVNCDGCKSVMLTKAIAASKWTWGSDGGLHADKVSLAIIFTQFGHRYQWAQPRHLHNPTSYPTIFFNIKGRGIFGHTFLVSENPELSPWLTIPNLGIWRQSRSSLVSSRHWARCLARCQKPTNIIPHTHGKI